MSKSPDSPPSDGPQPPPPEEQTWLGAFLWAVVFVGILLLLGIGAVWYFGIEFAPRGHGFTLPHFPSLEDILLW
jgi:hypothetical protein